ncbi:uncharacterized protein [Nicotiana tomentosiformis]|uniref:uncharacterized protein n=1 Tax=Nicotiana tomentosiformis TaxID=4098 RepID=UPI00388C6C7E
MVNPKGGKNTGHAMAVTTRSGRGGDATTLTQRRIVNDDVLVQEDEALSNVVQANDEVRIYSDKRIGKPRPTFMRLQIADRTMKRPLGIIDDVLVCVDKFILSADFVIFDCEVDYEVPIILGRPFLSTGKALVNVEADELTFRVGDENVVFHVCKSMRQPNNNEVCSFVNLVTEVIVDDASAVMNVDDTLEAVLLNHDDDKKEGFVECVGLDGYSGYNQILIAPERRLLSLVPMWVLLLQEFDLEIQDRKGSENQVADRLSRLEEEGRPHDDLEINDSFPDDQLLSISMTGMPWFANLANYLVSGIVPNEFSSNQRKKLKRDCLDYYWDEPYLFRICTYGVIRRYVPEE